MICLGVYKEPYRWGKPLWSARLLYRHSPCLGVVHGSKRGEALCQVVQDVLALNDLTPYMLNIHDPKWKRTRPHPIVIEVDLFELLEPDPCERVFEHAPPRDFYEIRASEPRSGSFAVPIRSNRPVLFFDLLMRDS